MNRFEGKVYIVTGGGSGIGAATVAQLLDEGASVIVVDLAENHARQTVETAGSWRAGGSRRSRCVRRSASRRPGGRCGQALRPKSTGS